MPDEPTSSQLDLSAGDTPYEPDYTKANALLDDAASRRRYRRFSFVLSVVVVVFFGLVLFKLIRAVASHATTFSPWIVGMFATVVVAMSVITLALLRATFASPGGYEEKTTESMPQVSVLSEALKALGDAVGALRETVGK